MQTDAAQTTKNMLNSLAAAIHKNKRNAAGNSEAVVHQKWTEPHFSDSGSWPLRLLLRLRKILKHQLRLLLKLRKLPSNSYQKDSVYFMPWLFSFWLNTNGWSDHVPSTIQRDITCWSSELWLNSLYFAQLRQKATKSLPALKSDLTVGYVDHAFQTCHVFWICHVITSNNCVQLLIK